MLVKVAFNERLFRFREEDEKELLLYNLRCGDIYFLLGDARRMILELRDKNIIEVDLENNIAKSLLLLEMVKSYETL